MVEAIQFLTHSGLCGSDIHHINKPLVLGHGRIGIIEEVGSACSHSKVSDRVGWGPANSTCGECDLCLTGKDAYCPNARLYSMHEYDTQGSVCSFAVCKEQWILHVPEALASEDAFPLVEYCKPYDRVGAIAIGGLGHLSLFSSAESKREEAMKLGTMNFALPEECPTTLLSVSLSLSTVFSPRLQLSSICPYFTQILARNATILPLSVDFDEWTAPYLPTVVFVRRNKMLDFAARYSIHSIVEKFPMTLKGVKAAVEKLRSGKMRYRGFISWEY
ncbi:chaperonin 10-like protein [Hypoxylon crocopeplum]|nr:chaperonin 10-like protein [Hypoxylon crocopeplum]